MTVVAMERSEAHHAFANEETGKQTPKGDREKVGLGRFL